MSNRKKVIIQTAREAGLAMKKAVPSAGVIQKEGRANIVTSADLASEKIIIDHLHAHFPNEPILSEETESELGDVLSLEKLWVIDPIDGTNNYRSERNYSCVSIGYLEKGVPTLTAIYDPFHDEMFTAELGKGAYCNEEKLSVSACTDLSQATVATDNSYDPKGTRQNLETLLKINPSPWVLMKGSAVLIMCEIAAGRTDLYFHTALKPWDKAGAFLLITEAGGKIATYEGSEATILSTNVVMGNTQLVKTFLEKIS
ncbi:MAG: inositol monophosphatase family protein [Microgenomates group bacterium]